jgi:hypothetical protein
MKNKTGGVFLLALLILGLIVGGVVVYNIAKPTPSYTPTGYGTYPTSSGSNTPSSYSNTGTASTSCGYGEPCCNDGSCDYGECQGGMCVHCGYHGETCCFEQTGSYMCHPGSTCENGRCEVTDDYNSYGECGFPGYKACTDDYGPYCSTGVYDSWTGICMHCGFLEQPCCPNTDYDCDYGQCVNGICKLVNQQNTNTGNTNPTPSTNNGNIYNSDEDYDDYNYDSYDTDNYDSYDTEDSSNTNPACGGLNQDCCDVGIREGLFGGIEAAGPRCNDDLECRGEVCVTGPSYESAPRGGY